MTDVEWLIAKTILQVAIGTAIYFGVEYAKKLIKKLIRRKKTPLATV